MKKKKTAEEKKKEFTHTPFRGLSSVKGALESKPEKKEVRPEKPETTRSEEEERDLFLRSIQGTKRLKPEAARKKAPEKREAPTDVRIDEEERKLFLASLKGLDTTFHDRIPETGPGPNQAVNRMRQIKNGSIRIDLELDLHGLTREEALTGLARFVTGAFNRGQKAILVITGKGNNSAAEPVLQSAVASWLREAGKKMVAEFAPAPRQMGGSGAFVVFLKSKDKLK